MDGKKTWMRRGDVSQTQQEAKIGRSGGENSGMLLGICRDGNCQAPRENRHPANTVPRPTRKERLHGAAPLMPAAIC